MHAQSRADSTVVAGRIIGADGRIPVRADVELTPIRATARAIRVRAAADGTFRVSIAGGGPFRVRVAGVGFVGLQRALPVTTPTTVNVVVTLAGLPTGLAKGPVVGIAAERDAEKPRPDMPPAVVLSARGNGRRTGTLRARRDTVAYRVVDITARQYLPPAGASAFRWSDDGEYDGLVAATAGAPVELVYDSTGVTFGGTSGLRVLDGHPIAPVVAQLDSIFAYEPSRRCVLMAPAPLTTRPVRTRADTEIARVIGSASVSTADPAITGLATSLDLIRQFLRADGECRTDPELGALVMAQFTPASPLWHLDDVMRRRVLLHAARHASGDARFNTPEVVAQVKSAFDAAITAARDTAARFDLYELAAETFMPADTVAAQSYTARFTAESYDNPRVFPLLKLTGYNRVLQPGRRVPAFTVPSLDSSGAAISDASLRGSVYLLDVWATWCRDCIVELPSLRALHEKYGSRGLRVVSVSVDEEQGTADRFRRIREPMPWTHGWAGTAPDGGGPLERFEVVWLPTTILVGRDGRILSLAPKLDSPGFDALVREALK
ncbi:MAG: TlpA family protein disulfide reductase [Gemmatimonadaceae bacterium]|nr:TlpA family protein disulfide reductase [Gemmatimonadaceae bacterium]